MSQSSLRLDWCSGEAARYAVMHWHYSKRMPVGKGVNIGVWEGAEQRFIGAITFGLGAGALTDGRRFGLAREFQVAELTRVALRAHEAPVTRIVSIALRMLSKQSPGLRLVISLADPRRNHVGAIYQAGNWFYVGRTAPQTHYVDKAGKEWHSRTVSVTGQKKHFGGYAPCLKPEDAVAIVKTEGKHVYVMPLDHETRERVKALSKPFPKRPKDQAPGDQPGLAGETPSRALQTTD